jgi:hypothetical protein
MILWISRRILLPSSDWLLTGRRLTITAFSSEKGRRKGISTSHGYIYSLQPSPQRRRFQSSKSIFVRLIPKCRVSCDEQRNSISSNTTLCHRQMFDFDCVFFGLWRFYLYPMMEHLENMFNGDLRKANFRPVVLKIISLIEIWRIANTRWLVALCKQRRGVPNQLILKDLIWDRSDWT